MRPSSWNGVGAMAKVPAALWVSFVIGASVQLRSFRSPHLTRSLTSGEVRPLSRWERVGVRGYDLSLDRNSSPGASRRPLPSGEGNSKSPRAHFVLFLGEENLLAVFDNILNLPSLLRRLHARLLHHPHPPNPALPPQPTPLPVLSS